MKYLGKITDNKDLVTKEYVDKTKIYYGVCNSSGTTASKTVTIDGITSLYEGLNIRIRFVNWQGYNGTPTLNVNSLGAKNIQRRSGANMVQYEWVANEIIDFVYYNDAWVAIDGAAATTSNYGYTILTDSLTSTSTAMAASASAVKALNDMIGDVESVLTTLLEGTA